MGSGEPQMRRSRSAVPERIERYLADHHLPFVHTTHVRAVAAQRFAAAEHVPGDRIAKPVVVSVDGELARSRS